MRSIYILKLCLLLSMVAGCSWLIQPKPVQSPEQYVKNSVKSKKQEKKQIQPKSLVKPITKVDVMLSSEEQEGLKEIKNNQIIYKGSSHSKRVALTFDDGPDEQFTKKILDILRKEKVRATFFVTGKMAKAYPEVLKRIDQEGHIIGNHTWNHPELTEVPLNKVEQEIQKTTKLIEKHIGKRVRFVRPPYGATNSEVVKEIKEDDYYLVNWNVDTNDWRGHDSKKIMKNVKHNGVTGSIILQHSAGQNLKGTVEALPKIIRHFKDKGYELVSLDQLLDIAPYQGTKQDVKYAPKKEKSKKENSNQEKSPQTVQQQTKDEPIDSPQSQSEKSKTNNEKKVEKIADTEEAGK